MTILEILGCGISIVREDLVNIASFKNHPNNPLKSAPICFPTYSGVVCARQKFVMEKGLRDILRMDYV